MAGVLGALFFILFVALGTWQVERRTWKLDLIARVEQRVHAPPVAAPSPAQWPAVTAALDEYRHVTAAGTFLDRSQTLVQAVTGRGSGHWVLTPLRMGDGSLVLVNRGFVPQDARDWIAGATVMRGATTPGAGAIPGSASTPSAASTHAGTSTSAMTTVTGLLRMTEPRGAFLRHNDPAHNCWYSRDVQAIAAARGLNNVAPYFIDADAGTAGEVPIGGLTVITFHNSHLVYAITWYTLALMVAGAAWLGVRNETHE